MVSYNSAESSGIVGIYLVRRYLSNINNTGLYREGGAILQRKIKPRILERSRKVHLKFINIHNRKINTRANPKLINCLDVNLDLNNVRYKICLSEYNHPAIMLKDLHE